MCRCWTCRSLRSSWSTAPATRTGRRPWTSPVSWAGCRWRWSRQPRTCRPAGSSLAGYLALFRQRRADLLGRGEPIGHTRTVATTWTLAFERPAAHRAGRGRTAAAAGVLRARGDPASPAAATPPGLAEPLGEEVVPVLAPLMEDPLAADDAIAALRRYSLLTPAADGSVSVHRLVQAVTADQMPAELAGAWRQAAATLIEAAIPDDTRQPAPGRFSPRCCHTPRRPSRMKATAWRVSPATCRPPGVTRPLASSTSGCLRGSEGLFGSGASGHPDHPRQPGPLDRGGGGCGRGP